MTFGAAPFAHKDALSRQFLFAGLRRVESVERVEFEQLDGERTRLVVTSSFDSKADRDGMLQSGMERGVTEGMERLDELVARLAPVR